MLGSGLRHTPEELPSAHWEPARPKVVNHVEHSPLPPSFPSGKTVSKTGLGGMHAASPAPYAAPSPLAAAGGSCESAGAGEGASASAAVAADAAASGLL